MNLPRKKWQPVGIFLAIALLFSLFGIPLASAQDETVVLHVYKFWDEGPGSYTLSYDLNGGEGETPPDQTGFAGTYIAVTDEIPEWEGYALAGWSLSTDGPVQYEAGDPILMDSDITLYAVWLEVFTVRLYRNMGTNDDAFEDYLVRDGDEFVLVNPFGTIVDLWHYQNHYTFTPAESGDYIEEGESVTITEDLDLYGQWTYMG